VLKELVRHDDEPTVDALEAMLDAPDPRRRFFAADVLFCFSLRVNEESTKFADRIVEALVRRVRQEQDPKVLRRSIDAFYGHSLQPDRPEILRHATHPDAGVRDAVAESLTFANPADDSGEARLLVGLCSDEAAEVRVDEPD
jgi:hypothetical protein